MFTGLVEGVGTLKARESRSGDVRLTVAVGTLPFTHVQLGESIAVNGCCLTVIEFDATSFAVDASNETLALTTLGQLALGASLNLERALLPTNRLGGHLVSGHVDGLATAVRCWEDARALRWRFELAKPLLRYIAQKGSVCVDGVSLTVNAADDSGFEVALIPHTVAHTAFHALHVGAQVNIEIDLLARYAERLQATKEWV